ncbi:sensor histidine kinase [Staphylospora marina]|uniref:sensor histidine kinase n=1 Tax=Staphylospora marina TaxID=2490858 RepID=UPI000F5BFF1E|nr:sensor histidine kinase [Staphylospora marina]
MKRALYIFLRERAGWIIVYYSGLGIVYLLFALILSFEKAKLTPLNRHLGYALLLSSVWLLLFLVLQFLRWYPYYRQLEASARASSVDWFAEWEKTGSPERDLVSNVIQHFYQLAVEERHQFQTTRQQHVEFMNLWVHQMKTPVSTLLLLSHQTNDISPEQRELLKSMEEEAEKISTGLDMVLSMARLTDFATDYQIRPVSLLEMVRDVIHSKKKLFIRYRIFPKLTAEQGDWIIYTDKKWNRFVIEQIIQNALKYASQSKQSSFLHITLEKQDQETVLTIRDEGPGIPPQDLPRVFEPFFTGENGRQFAQATGMGLYLVKKVLEKLNHSIHIESKVGKGTAVSITYTKQ